MRDFDYGYEPGEWDPTSLVVYLYDYDSLDMVDSLSVDVPFEVSDHGNVNVSITTERVLYDVAASLAATYNGALIGRRP